MRLALTARGSRARPGEGARTRPAQGAARAATPQSTLSGRIHRTPMSHGNRWAGHGSSVVARPVAGAGRAQLSNGGRAGRCRPGSAGKPQALRAPCQAWPGGLAGHLSSGAPSGLPGARTAAHLAVTAMGVCTASTASHRFRSLSFAFVRGGWARTTACETRHRGVGHRCPGRSSHRAPVHLKRHGALRARRRLTRAGLARPPHDAIAGAANRVPARCPAPMRARRAAPPHR